MADDIEREFDFFMAAPRPPRLETRRKARLVQWKFHTRSSFFEAALKMRHH